MLAADGGQFVQTGFIWTEAPRLNALFIGLYAFLGFALLSMVPEGKIELSGGFVLLAMLAAVHGILLFFSHALSVLKMKVKRSGRRFAQAKLRS